MRVQAPKLKTDARTRPDKVKSSADLEAEALAALPPFHARPVKCAGRLWAHHVPQDRPPSMGDTALRSVLCKHALKSLECIHANKKSNYTLISSFIITRVLN